MQPWISNWLVLIEELLLILWHWVRFENWGIERPWQESGTIQVRSSGSKTHNLLCRNTAESAGFCRNTAENAGLLLKLVNAFILTLIETFSSWLRQIYYHQHSPHSPGEVILEKLRGPGVLAAWFIRIFSNLILKEVRPTVYLLPFSILFFMVFIISCLSGSFEL